MKKNVPTNDFAGANNHNQMGRTRACSEFQQIALSNAVIFTVIQSSFPYENIAHYNTPLALARFITAVPGRRNRDDSNNQQAAPLAQCALKIPYRSWSYTLHSHPPFFT